MTTVGIVTPWIEHPELLPGYAAAVERADEVVIIDNGGAPWREFEHPRKFVVHTEPPQGFAASNNLGGNESVSDVVVFLNNDVQADPGWIDLVREQVEDGALYGPSIGRQRLAGEIIPYVEGWCVAATRETWKRIGGWDAERFPKPYWEDVELSLRAMQRGVELRRAPWPIHHLGGVSTSSVPGAWDGFEAQRDILEAEVKAILTGTAA